jgi:hypothetical protein
MKQSPKLAKPPTPLGVESTATISIREEADGSIHFSIEFDPPVHGETGESRAARLGTHVFRVLCQTIGGETI